MPLEIANPMPRKKCEALATGMKEMVSYLLRYGVCVFFLFFIRLMIFMVKMRKKQIREYAAVILFVDQRDPESGEILRVHGRTGLEWVTAACRNSRYISDIKAVGPQIIEETPAFRRMTERISTTSATTKVMMEGMPFRKVSAGNQTGLVIIFSNAVFVSGRTIDSAIEKTHRRGVPIAIPATVPSTGPISQPSKTFHHQGKLLVAAPFVVCEPHASVADALHLLLSQIPHAHLASHAVLQALAGIRRRGAGLVEFDIVDLENPWAIYVVSRKTEAEAAQRQLKRPPGRKFARTMVIANAKSGRGMRMQWLTKGILRMKQGASNGKSPDVVISEIETALREMGMDPEIVTSKSPEHATELARDCAKKKYDLVIAAGGDGAVNSVVNGLAGSKTMLGIIPLGTANVTAIELNIPSDIYGSCQCIVEGTPWRIDLGKINEHYFSCVAGVGFDAYVLRKAEQRYKKKFGGLGYVLAAAVSVFEYGYHSIRYTVDGDAQTRKAYLLMIGNGKHYGGDMILTPKAEMDDGRLDVVAFTSRRFRSILPYLWNLYKGRLPLYSETESFQATRLEISKHGRHLYHIDGEIGGKMPAVLEVVPRALTVLK